MSIARYLASEPLWHQNKTNLNHHSEAIPTTSTTMTTTANITRVWCLLIDDKGKYLGRDFIEVSYNAFVGTLTKAIKEQNPKRLGHVDTAELYVWRCKNRDVGKGTSQTLKKAIVHFDFSDESGDVECVEPDQTIDELSLDPKEMLLVQVPGRSYSSSYLKCLLMTHSQANQSKIVRRKGWTQCSAIFERSYPLLVNLVDSRTTTSCRTKLRSGVQLMICPNTSTISKGNLKNRAPCLSMYVLIIYPTCKTMA